MTDTELEEELAGFIEEGHINYLDESAQQHHDYFMAHGDPEQAASMLTRTLSESLMGNEGE